MTPPAQDLFGMHWALLDLSTTRKFFLLTHPFVQECTSSLRMTFQWKLRSGDNCCRAHSPNTRRFLWRLPSVPGAVEFYTGAGPSHNAKFAKFWSAKGRVLESYAKSTASDSSAHFQRQCRCFRQIVRFIDVQWFPKPFKIFNNDRRFRYEDLKENLKKCIDLWLFIFLRKSYIRLPKNFAIFYSFVISLALNCGLFKTDRKRKQKIIFNICQSFLSK